MEQRIGLDGQGLYGWDTINLGWQGDGLPTLKNQSIAGMVTPSFWMGSLALNPRPINFTNFNEPIPSLMQNLRNKTDKPIPSLSWSYTAGVYNLAPKIFGSLILGGYDSTRFVPNSVTFPFGKDISYDFQVAIQSISTDLDDATLLDQGIIAYISTMVADIWLPESVCKKFEDAFGLTWDPTTELYLLNNSLHQNLLEKNPSVNFRVGPETSGAAVPINMPYHNFYHTATKELTNSSSKMYFPLKRAANDTQYVLGRTFLQSAHLSADYERKVFNLSQAKYPSSQEGEKLVSVLPPLTQTNPGDGENGGSGNGDSNGNGGSNGDASGLGTGAIVGIAVGLGVVAAVIGAIAFILLRRRKAKPKHELDDTDVQNHTIPHEVSGDNLKVEMMGGGMSHEVMGDMDPKAELAGTYHAQKLAEAEGNNSHVYEMPGDDPTPHEMAGENTFHKDQMSYGHGPNQAPPAINITHASPVPTSVHPSDNGFHQQR